MPFHPIHHYYTAGDWLWSIFSTLLFVAFIVAAVMLLARAFAGSRRGGPGAGAVGRPVAGPGWFGPPGAGWRGLGGGGAERILAERYARGEIGEEEYRERLEVLRQAGSDGPAWAYQPPPPPPPAPTTAAAPAPAAPYTEASPEASTERIPREGTE